MLDGLVAFELDTMVGFLPEQVFFSIPIVIKQPTFNQDLTAVAAIPFGQGDPVSEFPFGSVVQQEGVVYKPKLPDLYPIGRNALVDRKLKSAQHDGLGGICQVIYFMQHFSRNSGKKYPIWDGVRDLQGFSKTLETQGVGARTGLKIGRYCRRLHAPGTLAGLKERETTQAK